jgi:hypothetical protein
MSWSAGAFAAVFVGETDDVIEMRRRDLEHIAIGDRLHLVNGLRRHAISLPDLEVHRNELVTLPDPIDELAGHEVDGFVLDVVVLLERISPALMWRIFPTYWSVWAQMVSWPQGFGTVLIVDLPDIGG